MNFDLLDDFIPTVVCSALMGSSSLGLFQDGRRVHWFSPEDCVSSQHHKLNRVLLQCVFRRQMCWLVQWLLTIITSCVLLLRLVASHKIMLKDEKCLLFISGNTIKCRATVVRLIQNWCFICIFSNSCAQRMMGNVGLCVEL